MNRFMSLAAAVLTICTAQSAFAEEPLTGVVYGGGTISESQSGYAGGIVSLPGATLGHGLGIKAGAAGGRYEYDAGGTKITGKYGAADLALVSQHSGQWGWANISAGVHFSNTKLSPNDPGNKLRGSRWDLALQTDGAVNSRDWRLGWYGSYGVFDKTYQAKLSAGKRVGRHDLRAGIEGGVQGDPSYTRGFIGGFASREVGQNVTLQVSAGASEQAGRGARAYGSLAISKLF